MQRLLVIGLGLISWWNATSIVSAQQAIFSAERLVAAATVHLQRQFPFPIVAEPTQSLSDVEFRTTTVHAEFEYLPRSTRRAFHTIRITFFCDGSPCRELLVPFKVQKKIAIPRAKRDLPSGTILQPADVEWDTAIVALDTPGLAADDVVGYRLTRSITAGSRIDTKDLQHPETLSAGSTVQIIVRTPHVLIRTTGKLLEAAVPGKEVRVIPKSGRAAIRGMYKGNGIVEIQ